MKKRKLTVLCLAAVTVFSLCGCRETDKIQKIVYTEDAAEADETEVVRDFLSEEINNHLSEKENSDQADDTDRKEKPQKGENGNTTEAADAIGALDSLEIADSAAGAVDPNATAGGNSGEGSGGSGGDSEDETGSVDSDEEGAVGWEEGEPEDGEEPPQEEEPDDGKEPDDSEGGEDGRNEDDANGRQVYDPDGNIIMLPETVNSVAAPGEAGLIVQMLGGENILVASSNGLLNNQVVQEVFADEGISETVSLWSNTENGSEPMPDDEFQQLLALSPDCCIGFSGSNGSLSFNDSQLQALAENNIAYYPLPDMNTSDSIKKAVQAVGEILGEREVGGTTSEKLAQKWIDYEADLVQQVVAKKGWFGRCKEETNVEGTPLSPSLVDVDTYGYGQQANLMRENELQVDGKFAVIFWKWDPEAVVTYTEQGENWIEQSGVAVTYFGIGNSPVSYYMNVAAVENTSQRDLRYTYEPRDSYRAYIPLYRIDKSGSTAPLFGPVNADYVGTGISWSLDAAGFFDAVFNPMDPMNPANGGELPVLPTGVSATYRGRYQPEGDTPGGWAEQTSIIGKGTMNGTHINYGARKWNYLGNPSLFPHAIAASQTIRDNIEASKGDKGLYATRQGISVPGALIPRKNETYLGAADKWEPEELEKLENCYTTNQMDYDVIVNPSGAGSWLNGSVESCMESVWINSQYYGDYSEADVRSVIQEFYRTFYRCDDAPVDIILAGVP